MKLSYSTEDVERWRDKRHRRTPKLAVTNERQALAFINRVGFCLASKADDLEVPNLWEAVSGEHSLNGNGKGRRGYYLSYAWEIQSILPNHGSVYYGKIIKRRPSIVSREFLPYFYALSERTGERDEHAAAFAGGKLSVAAKAIMDTLMKSAPMTAKEMRDALAGKENSNLQGLEKGLEELQRKMYICRIIGEDHQFGAAWAPVIKCFGVEVRKAHKISADAARLKLLEKYFENQLMSSVDAIHRVFAWPKKVIYQVLGRLIGKGIVTSTISLDGKKGKCYCLIC